MRIRFNVASPREWRKTNRALLKLANQGKLLNPRIRQPEFVAQHYLADKASGLYFRGENALLAKAFERYKKGQLKYSDLLPLTLKIMRQKRHPNSAPTVQYVMRTLAKLAKRSIAVSKKVGRARGAELGGEWAYSHHAAGSAAEHILGLKMNYDRWAKKKFGIEQV